MKPITTLRYGHFESMPAIFTKPLGEAWVLYGGIWRELGPFEVSFGAGLMTKESFKKTYGKLPPLPKHAFRRPT